MRARRPVAGVVYVSILIVCVVLLIGVGAYFVMMRQGRQAAYRSLDTQYAHALARSGLALTQAALTKALHEPASALRTKLLEPLESLKTAPGGLIEMGRTDLVAEFPAVVDELARDLPGGRSSLEALTARFYIPVSQLSPLPELPLGGKVLARGGREKCGRLYLECSATLATGGLMGRLTQSVQAFEEFRVVHAPVPVLSDFTLFLRDVPRGNEEKSPANALEAQHVGLLDSGSTAVPLILNNGKKDMQEFASSQLDLPYLKNQGWVFLGGAAVALNLSYSQDESANNDRAVGEDFHFYQQDPRDFEAGRAVNDPTLSAKANEHLSGTNFWQVRTWDMGVHSLKDGPLKDQYEKIFEHTPAGRRLGSVLKLFGVAPDKVSPTIVFGHVLAGFFRITAVVPANPEQTDFDGFYTLLRDNGGGVVGFLAELFRELAPFAGRILYTFDPYLSGKYVYLDPANPGQLLPMGRGASEDNYKALCAGFKTRSYNVGLLHLKAHNQAQDPKDRATALGLAETMFSDAPDAPEVNQLPANLLPPPWAALDKLDLTRLDPDAIATALIGACAWRSKPKDMGLDTLRGLSMLRGDKLDLGSTVFIDGPVSLPALSAVERGGMIVANEFVLEGAIPQPASGVLVLVARTGGIRFPGAPTQIHASLIALKGTIAPQGPPALTGNLVANTLDLGCLTASGLPAHLDYDPKLKAKAIPDPAATGLPEGLVVDFSRRFVRVD